MLSIWNFLIFIKWLFKECMTIWGIISSTNHHIKFFLFIFAYLAKIISILLILKIVIIVLEVFIQVIKLNLIFIVSNYWLGHSPLSIILLIKVNISYQTLAFIVF
jgi:hypothetical protein